MYNVFEIFFFQAVNVQKQVNRKLCLDSAREEFIVQEQDAIKIQTNLPLRARCLYIHRKQLLPQYMQQLHNYRYLIFLYLQQITTSVRLLEIEIYFAKFKEMREQIIHSRTIVRIQDMTIARTLSKLTRPESIFYKGNSQATLQLRNFATMQLIKI